MPGVHKKVALMHRGRHRAKRPRTFKSEALAKIWCDANGIKKYTLVRPALGISKKLRLVLK